MRTATDLARSALKGAMAPLAAFSTPKKEAVDFWVNHRFPPSTIYQITFRAADGCNLRCKTCHFSLDYRKGQKTLLMDPELVRDVVETTKGSVNLMGFSASGEPLINPGIDKMVGYASSAGIRTKVGTNVMLLTPDMSKRLLDAGLSVLKVSIDGATKETYETVRVGASFEKLRDHLEEFRRLRDKMGAKTKIFINTVITNDNHFEVEMVKEVFAHIGDKFSAKPLTNFGIMQAMCEYSPTTLTEQKCSQLVKRMTILTDGRATICCGDNQNIGVVGNVKETSALEVWNSDLYNKWRGYHRTGQTQHIPLCKDCVFGGA
jgi:molybdenum cofactor biosynthesis enzyme MoaA